MNILIQSISPIIYIYERDCLFLFSCCKITTISLHKQEISPKHTGENT